ncbi:MAG: hypothetical protein H0X41_10195, partial [Chitinophagaceae bacterium]|nr:hypothetical protein [Chitinophagaceae bacterium]
MDGDHNYLLSQDYKELSSFRTKLDDELNGNGWAFLNRFSSVLRMRLEKADSLLIKNKSNARRHREIRRMLDNAGGYNNYIASVYCDILSNTFDPHTEYMPPAQKEQFESQLSTQGYYFGFGLNKNNKEETEIVRLMPGSPAWK